MATSALPEPLGLLVSGFAAGSVSQRIRFDSGPSRCSRLIDLDLVGKRDAFSSNVSPDGSYATR
jgi:hypothetical protein